MPTWIEPMKALLAARIPADRRAWAFEFKWDGIRALAFHGGNARGGDPRGFRILSRNAIDATFRYPELAELGPALGHRTAILDGEIIAVDAHGQPSFPLLQKRMHVTRAEAVKHAAETIPVQYVLFDVLYLDGRDLRGLPWEERREQLESLSELLPPACRLSPARVGRGEDMLQVATEKGLEGIVAKRVSSAYESGERSGAWLKIKLVKRQEMVVGGWVPEVGGDGRVRGDRIGSLVLGYYDAEKGDGKLHHAGSVGTGFTDETSAELVKQLRGLAVEESPFDAPIPPSRWRGKRPTIHWVKPRMVVEVEYRRWPEGGLMHQTAFKGVREDKSAREVVRETPAVPGESEH